MLHRRLGSRTYCSVVSFVGLFLCHSLLRGQIVLLALCAEGLEKANPGGVSRCLLGNARHIGQRAPSVGNADGGRRISAPVMRLRRNSAIARVESNFPATSALASHHAVQQDVPAVSMLFCGPGVKICGEPFLSQLRGRQQRRKQKDLGSALVLPYSSERQAAAATAAEKNVNDSADNYSTPSDKWDVSPQPRSTVRRPLSMEGASVRDPEKHVATPPVRPANRRLVHRNTPERFLKRFLPWRLRATPARPALFPCSSITGVIGRKMAERAPWLLSGSRGARRSESEFGGGTVLLQSLWRRVRARRKTGKAKRGGLKERVTQQLSRVFSRKSVTEGASRKELLEKYLASGSALREELACVRVKAPAQRQRSWSTFCNRFVKMPLLSGVCALQRSFLAARLRDNDQCEGKSIVDCLQLLEIPLIQPLLTHMTVASEDVTEMPSENAPTMSSGRRTRASVSVKWGLSAIKFFSRVLSMKQPSMAQLLDTSSCEFGRVALREEGRSRRKKKRGRSQADPFQLDEESALILIYAAAGSARPDGMLLHLTVSALDDSQCPTATRRGRRRKVRLQVSEATIQVKKIELFEAALTQAVADAVVPSHKDCTTHDQAGLAAPLAGHNCEAILKGEKVRHILEGAATGFVTGMREAEHAISSRISMALSEPSTNISEETFLRLRMQVFETMTQVRQSYGMGAKIMNFLGRQQWLVKLLGSLMVKLSKLGSSASQTISLDPQTPLLCLEASARQMALEASAHVLCSTGLEGFEIIMRNALTKQVSKEIQRAKATLGKQRLSPQSSRPSDQAAQLTEQSSASGSLAEFESSRVPSELKYGRCSRRRLISQLRASSKKIFGVPTSLFYRDTKREAAGNNHPVSRCSRDNTHRAGPRPSFAEEPKESRWKKLKKYGLAAAILAAVIGFSYAGPVITVVIIVVGIVVAVLIRLIPAIMGRMRERAAAKPREGGEEESRPLVSPEPSASAEGEDEE